MRHLLSMIIINEPASSKRCTNKTPVFRKGSSLPKSKYRQGIYRAKILENAVFNHLLFSGYEVKVGAVENKEVDFVAEKGGEKHYYQVALSLNDSKTWKREVGNLKDIKDNYPKTLITMEPFSGNSMDGIKITDIRSFLKSG